MREGMKKLQVAELERLTPDSSGMSVVEHLHRYALAAELCGGKDVLDIASGEGYGSNLLAQAAKTVTGVDISTEAIEQSKTKYVRPNLRFLQGAADAIPMDSGSIDVAVSFETLEHHDKHEEMLSEIKRILRPNGLLLISTPDKRFYSDIPKYKNEFHVKELYTDDFKALIGKFFSRHRLLFQISSYGTLVVPERDGRSFLYYRGDFQSCKSMQTLSEPEYNIAVASDGELPDIAVSFYEGNLTVRHYDRLLKSQEEVIDDLKNSMSYRLGRLLTLPLRSLLGR
jgi:2-polyprenyl-3-methyl-5-hydroxy-6-metoxy-1,4-benzoquinol methylase